MEKKESTTTNKQDKINTCIGALAVAGLLIWFGISMFGGKKADTDEDRSKTVSEVEQGADESEEPTKTTDPDTDIRRAVMVDTVSKWDDVDEFSLQIEENVSGEYVGERVVNITANYNGVSSNLEDALVVYCNKIATAIDLTKHSAAELSIVWTVPVESSDPIGMCHYHGQDGVLIYDDESNGILTNK